jgi:hypothetical protein
MQHHLSFNRIDAALNAPEPSLKSLRRTSSKKSIKDQWLDRDCQRVTEIAIAGRRSSEIAKVFDGKMCDVGLHHRLRRPYSPANTIDRFENGRAVPIPANLKALWQAFEAAGVPFIDADETAGEGVRHKKLGR